MEGSPPRAMNHDDNIEVVDPTFGVWDGEGDISEDDEGLQSDESGGSEFEDDEDYAPSSDGADEEEEFEILNADSEEPTCSSNSEDDATNDNSSFKVLLTDSSVQQHGVMSSVRHHQCCDALAMDSPDSDWVTIVDGRHALLYNLVNKEIMASVRLGFEPYSIARYGPLLAAGGDYDIVIFCLVGDSSSSSSQATGLIFKMMAWLTVGYEGRATSMNNSLRFGKCGNELRLIAANQDGYVSIFAVPDAFLRARGRGSPSKEAESSSSSTCRGQTSQSEPAPSTPFSPLSGPGDYFCTWSEIGRVRRENFLCHSLRKGCPGAPGYRMMPRRVGDGEAQQPWPFQGELAYTDCIGRFSVPVNCASPSPDGRWMAVVGDSHAVSLLSFATGYHMEARVELAFSQASRRQRGTRKEACQYVAWNSSSTLVAVSSDSLRMVKVWAVDSAPDMKMPKGSNLSTLAVAAILSIEGDRLCPRPCLALQFDAVDDSLLYFVERNDRLHAVDTRGDQSCHQIVHLNRKLREECPQVLSESCLGGHKSQRECQRAGCLQYAVWPRERSSSTNGLAVSLRHGVLVACRERLLQFPVLRQWDILTHRYFSQQFKDAVACVLTIAHHDRSCEQGEDTETRAEENLVVARTGFWSLPSDLLLKIIGAAAVPVNAWVKRDPPPQQEATKEDTQ
eukprot:TRINITY_DN15658_c0_g1_i1.p1 TRINITY_DN15658_c0_g1~~TRINITY_DN15658_c0_g1_i1.p1  ORF type:complete len:677 (+),score=92.24 TRINITY_DN15658_c0_g1_i1:156-2186(+)